MKSLRDLFSRMNERKDLADEFFAHYEAKRQPQTELITALEEGLRHKLDDEGREWLDMLSEVYGDVEAIAARSFFTVGENFAYEIIKAIMAEKDAEARAAKAAHIQALITGADPKEADVRPPKDD